MRNLKKILALVLALVMSMSLVSVAGAKYTVEGYSDSDKVAEEYTEAVSVLSGLGIFVGDDRGFRPEDTITRAEVATLIYRIVTGDTTKTCEGAKVYADYGKFEDCADHWAKGMINFCANQGIILGYSDTKFGPDDNITGYQAILMLLRAIGWDKNGESLNPEWRTISAGKAQLMGWTEKVNMNGLGNAATRQVVAELLFNAINTAQFTFTTLGGYDQDDNILSNNPADAIANATLGYQNFKLAYDPEVKFDNWGHPFHVWYIESNNVVDGWGYNEVREPVVAWDVYEAEATYTKATSECDVYEDLGLTEDTIVGTVYVNGRNLVPSNILFNDRFDEFDGEINAAATKSKIGAQGRLTEIYHVYDVDNNGNPIDYYTMVMKDQFLARVDDVTEVEYDDNDHIEEYATLYLTVWHDEDESEELILEAEKDWEYEEGDYLLINARTVDYKNDAAVVDATNMLNEVYEILGYAETTVSKQYANSNKDSHFLVSLDEDILDAVRYGLDEAKNIEEEKYTWFYDTYGNIIGSELVETVDTYGTIKNIWWVDTNEDDTDGYAKATIVLMDGSTTVMKVTKIAGQKLDGVEGTANVSYADGHVSSSRGQNTAAFAYKALYKIDGSELKIEEPYKLENAQLIPGVPELTTAINANKNTKFLINEASKGCNPYTGIKNVPEYKAVDNVWYVDLNDDNHAEYVFVGSTTAKGSDPAKDKITYNTFFAYTEDTLIKKNILKGTEIVEFELRGGMVDGKAETLKFKNDAAGAGKANIEELKDNQGKLMYIEITNGYVTDVEIVHDGATQYLTELKGYAVYAGLAHKSNDTYLKNGVFEDVDGNSYYVDDAEEFSYDGTLKSSYNHDEDAHLFFVFAKAGNSDEQIVKHIYITTEAGAEAPAVTPETPAEPTLKNYIDALSKAVADLKAAIATINGYEPSEVEEIEWALENKYTKAYDALYEAVDAVDEALDALNAVLEDAEEETVAELQDDIDTALALANTYTGKVNEAVTNLVNYAAAAAVAEVEAADEDDEDALAAAYANVMIAALIADVAEVDDVEVDGWDEALEAAEAVVGLEYTKAEIIKSFADVLKETFEAAIAEAETAGFDVDGIAIPTVENTTAFAEKIVVVTGKVTKVDTIKAAVAQWTKLVNDFELEEDETFEDAMNRLTGIVVGFLFDEVVEAYIETFTKAELATAQNKALADLNSDLLEAVKEHADYIYIVATDAEILDQDDVDAYIDEAKEDIKEFVTIAALDEYVDAIDLTDVVAAFYEAMMDDLADLKKEYVEQITVLDSTEFTSADWKVLKGYIETAQKAILAVEDTDDAEVMAQAVKTANKAIADKLAALAKAAAEKELTDAKAKFTADAFKGIKTKAAAEEKAAALIASFETVEVAVTAFEATSDAGTVTVVLTSNFEGITTKHEVTVNFKMA